MRDTLSPKKVKLKKVVFLLEIEGHDAKKVLQIRKILHESREKSDQAADQLVAMLDYWVRKSKKQFHYDSGEVREEK